VALHGLTSISTRVFTGNISRTSYILVYKRRHLTPLAMEIGVSTAENGRAVHARRAYAEMRKHVAHLRTTLEKEFGRICKTDYEHSKHDDLNLFLVHGENCRLTTLNQLLQVRNERLEADIKFMMENTDTRLFVETPRRGTIKFHMNTLYHKMTRIKERNKSLIRDNETLLATNVTLKKELADLGTPRYLK
jgi:hypothetical protein